MSDCKFCDLADGAPSLNRYGTVFVALDKYPVAPMHWLVIPLQHRDDYFDLTEQEVRDTNVALNELRDGVFVDDKSVTGFNIGWNCGPDAGRTVMHAHAHLIPRRAGDHPEPAGGVRAVIPGKQHYSEGATA